MRIRTALAAAILIAVSPLIAIATLNSPVAYACSIGAFPDTETQMASALEGAQAVAFAEVTSSETFTFEGTAGDMRPDAVRAFINPVATLRGNVGGGDSIGPLGFLSPSCEGGPSLAAGDRTLLFLRNATSSDSDWSLNVATTVVFAGQQAFLASSFGERTVIGSSTDIAELVLDLAGAPSIDRTRALEFIQSADSAPNTARMPSGGTITPPDTGDGGLR